MSEKDIKTGVAAADGQTPGRRILCVDDEPAIRMSIEAFLQDMGFEVSTAPDGTTALALAGSSEFDAILLDLAMPGMSGLETLKRLTQNKPSLPVVVVSGTGSIQDVIAALRLGAWDFITKPIEDMALLFHSLDRAMERARLLRENRLHRDRLEMLVAKRTAKLCREIADRRAMEKALRASLAEKEVLLKEVHHRVKNNLQIVSSLLSLQALKCDDDKLAAPLQDSQARVRAMALVHEKLYRSKDLSCIDFSEYLRELAQFLLQAHTQKNTTVTPDIQCESFTLPVDLAIPCGLILSELVTNCLKHAFLGRQAGRITLRAFLDPEGAHLVVKDDGLGLPPGFEIDKTESLGLQLVTNLTRQLRGGLRVETGQSGTAFHLVFPPQGSCLTAAPVVSA
jgi:two-component sensor histidine kinase